MKTFRSSENVNDTSDNHYLFNQDVTALKLRKFDIVNVGCEMIWHCNTQVCVEEMSVRSCHKLKNVFAYSSGDGIKIVESLHVDNCDSLNCIWNISCGDDEAAFTQQLKKLCIERCPSLHRVFSFSSTARSVVVFPKLCYLILKNNGNLKSIFKGVDAENATEFSLQEFTISGCPKLEPSSLYFWFWLLNHSERNTEADIALENEKVRVKINEYQSYMLIDGVESLMDMLILEKMSTPPRCFFHIHWVKLQNLLNLPAATLWHFLQSLPNLVELEISRCRSTEVIFRLEEGLNPKKLPQLTILKLTCLKKLTCVWMKGIPRELSQRFQNLQELHVKECHKLRNLLTLSMVKHLPNLTALIVKSCSMVEEICFNEGKAVEGGVKISNETIEFPRVETLIFGNLPKLTSFCAAQVCAFKWPSLTKVVVTNCPSLGTFTWAVSNTRMLKEVETKSKKYPLMEDLNATIQFITMKRDQRAVLMKSEKVHLKKNIHQK